MIVEANRQAFDLATEKSMKTYGKPHALKSTVAVAGEDNEETKKRAKEEEEELPETQPFYPETQPFCPEFDSVVENSHKQRRRPELYVPGASQNFSY
jgi:hypothetical protein